MKPEAFVRVDVAIVPGSRTISSTVIRRSAVDISLFRRWTTV